MREMQIKTAIRVHCSRLNITKQKGKLSVGKDVENLEPSYIADENKMVHLLWKMLWQFSKKLNRELPYEPAKSCPRYIPKRIEKRYSKHLYTNVSSNTIQIGKKKKRKQLKCLSVD